MLDKEAKWNTSYQWMATITLCRKLQEADAERISYSVKERDGLRKELNFTRKMAQEEKERVRWMTNYKAAQIEGDDRKYRSMAKLNWELKYLERSSRGAINEPR